MKDPRRLMQSGADAFERSLLESARSDGGSTAAYQRTLGALGIGVAVPLAASVAHATAGASAAGKVGATAASKIGVALVAKWVTFGATVGLASMGGLHLITAPPAPASDPATRHAVHSAPRVRVRAAPVASSSPARDEPEPDLSSITAPSTGSSRRERDAESVARQNTPQTDRKVEPPQEAAYGSAPAPSPQQAAPRVGSTASLPPTSASARPTAHAHVARGSQRVASELEQEVQDLDGVRRALSAGNARQALLMLGLYRGRFPSGALRPEAMVLEVQALLLAGERQRATTLAERILAAAPHGQHAKIVRSLIAQRQKQ